MSNKKTLFNCINLLMDNKNTTIQIGQIGKTHISSSIARGLSPY